MIIEDINKTSKTILVFICAFVCLAVLTPQSFAWQHSRDTVANEAKVSDLEVVVEEEFTSPGDVSVGDIIDKKVFVKNTGSFPALVRVMIYPNLIDTISNNQETLSNDSISYTINDDWEDGEDGYFYYSNILMPDEEIDPIIDSVEIKSLPNQQDDISMNLKLDLITEACGVTKNYIFQEMWWNYDGVSTLEYPLSYINDLMQELTDKFFDDEE